MRKLAAQIVKYTFQYIFKYIHNEIISLFSLKKKKQNIYARFIILYKYLLNKLIIVFIINAFELLKDI